MLEDVFKRSEREVFGSGANITASGPLLVRAVSGEVISHISGEVVQVSGQQVRIEGYDYESSVWRNLRVTQSGEIAIHATIVDIVQARISGQAVKISGEVVQISGQTVVAEVSGDTVVAKISGEAVRISGQLVPVSGAIYAQVSGQVISKVSGEAVRISGQLIVVSGAITANISGQVISKISGEAVRISGQLVPISGAIYAEVSGQVIARISGQLVSVSGQIISKVSGETIYTQTPTTIRAGYALITSLSGGTELSSGEVVITRVRSLPGNANMWLGAPGVLSGTGFLLQGGEGDEFEIGNLNQIYLFAANSGEYVTYRGVDA